MDAALRMKFLLGTLLIMVIGWSRAEQICSPILLDLDDPSCVVYAPWRETYKDKSKRKHCHQCRCVFCAAPCDEGHNFILARYEHCFVLMNIYPYTKGHLLVVPYQHTANLSALTPEARLEIMNVVAFCLDHLKETLPCEGFNVGMNIGEAARATVPDHLHVHVMPRYKVDAGFAHLIGGIKVVDWDLEELYHRLLPIFNDSTCRPHISSEITSLSE